MIHSAKYSPAVQPSPAHPLPVPHSSSSSDLLYLGQLKSGDVTPFAYVYPSRKVHASFSNEFMYDKLVYIFFQERKEKDKGC